jgi:TonB family protein
VILLNYNLTRIECLLFLRTMGLLSAVSICGLFLTVFVPAAKTSGRIPSGRPNSAIMAQPPEIPSYPDSTPGLEHLVKDIMKAQKENDAARAEALLQSLVLPNHALWYQENFDESVARLTVPAYSASANSLSAQLARFFLDMEADAPQRIEAVRFGKNCDDSANAQMLALLFGRLKEVPIYEVRFVKGSQFRRLAAFAYVDGGFRFVILPSSEKPAASEAKPRAEGEPIKRVAVGGNVQAARLVKRVQPFYPEAARSERISGVVKLHVIVGKDGTVRSLQMVSGVCSLAMAAVDAVRQWRYQPTLLNGVPIEVDTQVDVIFSLSQ